VIHELEPGVGARGPARMLNAKAKVQNTTESADLATDIENQFDALPKKHYDKPIQKYGVSNEQLKLFTKSKTKS
jgi:RNA polymerase sigma-54 factor